MRFRVGKGFSLAADLGAQFGAVAQVYVNDRQVSSRRQLQDGDRLRVGRAFVFELCLKRRTGMRQPDGVSSEPVNDPVHSKLVAHRTHPAHERANRARGKSVHEVSVSRDEQGEQLHPKSLCDHNAEGSQDIAENAKLEQAYVELAATDARLKRELQEVDAESELARSKIQMLKEKVVIFEPGGIGIKANWDSGLITNINPGGQAERLGVKCGWTFSRLEDTQYTEQRFDALLAGSQSFSVTFITGQSMASEAQSCSHSRSLST